MTTTYSQASILSPTPAPISHPLPPTVNMHVLGHCNFECRYCYARFVEAKAGIPVADARVILAQLPERGVNRVTFAGGEPTLHPDLLEMLRACAEFGLVANIVTNGSRIDRDWCRVYFPWLRWLTLSCDSHLAATNNAHGRRPRRRLPTASPVATHVAQVARWIQEWNAPLPKAEHVRLKVNLVVTQLNADEDPSAWLRGLSPSRVKLMQQVVIPGENEDAADLHCSGPAFDRYARRVRSQLADDEVTVVAERSDQLHRSYSMVDPKGRFRQSRPEGYVTSEPIVEIGLDAAWRQVGTYDPEVFDRRGGNYEPGEVAAGPRNKVIAVEGLDGSGKSTVAALVAERTGAARLSCPPRELRRERQVADGWPPEERRAWYYRAGRESMRKAIDCVFGGRGVVLDRSPATTAAYAAAEQGRVATPADLRHMATPDAVYLLEVPEELRLARLGGRGALLTAEEHRLERDDRFRERVLAGYRALGAISIDASGSPEEVAEEVIRRSALPRGGENHQATPDDGSYKS